MQSYQDSLPCIRRHLLELAEDAFADEAEHFTFLRLARHDGLPIRITAFQRRVTHIQAPSRLSAFLVRPVASETVLRKNRPHFSSEIRPGLSSV